MAQRVVAVARATGALTGGGAIDYCADLDMNLVADGKVTIEILPTLALLTNIELTAYAGPAATPTGPMTNGVATIRQDLALLTGLVCSCTVETNERYFRAGVIGTGAGGPVGSDAVVNYIYKPKCANP